jgi:hypothetical protein
MMNDEARETREKHERIDNKGLLLFFVLNFVLRIYYLKSIFSYFHPELENKTGNIYNVSL